MAWFEEPIPYWQDRRADQVGPPPTPASGYGGWVTSLTLSSEVTVRRTLFIAVSTTGLMLIGAASAAACPSHAAGTEPEGLLGSVVTVVVELLS